MRPLWWEFPDAGHDVEDQYLLGPDLLVAPVATQGATSRSVVFPGSSAVEWESLWDPQTVVKGGQTKTIDVHKPQLWITDVCRENCSPCTVSVWINK